MKLITGLALVSAASLLACTAANARPDYGVGIGAGSLGASAQLIVGFHSKFNVTTGFNYFDYNDNVNTKDADLKGNARLTSVDALMNWHPWGGTFHISTGVIYNLNKITVDGKPAAQKISFGGQTFTIDQIGNLNGKVTFNALNPYLGFGWNTKNEKGFGMSFDAGVAYTGGAHTTLNTNFTDFSDHPIAGKTAQEAVAELNKALEKERQNVDDKLDKLLRYHPIVRLGIYYIF